MSDAGHGARPRSRRPSCRRACQAATEAAGPDPLVGARLRHFEVDRLLGRGGMGSVYLGKDTSLERPVALKVLAPDIAHDPDVVARFEREARAQARLRHPNVAQIHFIGEESAACTSSPWSSWRGRPSTRCWPSGGCPGPRRSTTPSRRRGACAPRWPTASSTATSSRRTWCSIARAGIKILDFGLVKSLHGDAELTRNGAIIGSPLYMAPEQGRGEDVDHRADIYSLGCALYHMLTGPPALHGPVPGRRHRHAHDRSCRRRCAAWRPTSPSACSSVVERMMAKTPRRSAPPTYDDLIAALEARARRNASSPASRPARWRWPSTSPPCRRCWTCSGPGSCPAAVAYFIVCHRLTGQTLGKRILRLAGHRPRRPGG